MVSVKLYVEGMVEMLYVPMVLFSSNDIIKIAVKNEGEKLVM